MKKLLLLACLLCATATASDSESFDMDGIQERGVKNDVRTDIPNTWEEWVKKLGNNPDDHQSKTSSQVEEKEYKAVCSVLQKISNKECNEVDLKEIAWNIIDLCMENNTCAKNIVKHASFRNFDYVPNYMYCHLANDVEDLLSNVVQDTVYKLDHGGDITRQMMILPEYIATVSDDDTFGIDSINEIFDEYISMHQQDYEYDDVYFLKSLFVMLCRFPNSLSEKVLDEIGNIVKCIGGDNIVNGTQNSLSSAKRALCQWLLDNHVEV